MATSNTIHRKPVPISTNETVYHAVDDDPPHSDDNDQSHTLTDLGPTFSFWNLSYLVMLVVLATMVLFAVAAYLSFLWFAGSNHGGRRRIVLSNWVTTSVGICGVAIRWASGSQIIFCTSVLALHALRSGTNIGKLPRLSTLRYSNSGPLDFLWIRPVRLMSAANWRLISTIAISILITILLQLSSTLLLSDLALAPAETFSNSTKAPLLTNETELYQIEGANHFYTDVILSTPPSYPLFAEWSAKDLRYQNSTIDDTGPVIRALLPVSTENNRSRLVSYNGSASLYDARVICSPAQLSNLKLVGVDYNNLQFSGNVSHSVAVAPMAGLNISSGTPASFVPQQFSCNISESQIGDSYWPLFTCKGSSYDGLINSLDPVYNQSQIHSRQSPGAYVTMPIGVSWMVINVTNMTTVGIDIPSNIACPNEGPCSSLQFGYSYNNSDMWRNSILGHWTRVTSTQRDGLFVQFANRNLGYDPDPSYLNQLGWMFSLDVSYCSSAFPYMKELSIYANRETMDSIGEPLTLQDGIKQIGATNQRETIAQRGIMTLNKTSIDEQLSREVYDILHRQDYRNDAILPTSRLISSDFSLRQEYGDFARGTTRNVQSWHGFLTDLTKRVGWQPDTSPGWSVASEERTALFQKIMESTKSPALAIQSTLHTYATDRYYKYTPLYTNETSQQLTFVQEAVQPVRTRGYIAVMAGLAAHLVLVAYIVIVFGATNGFIDTVKSLNQAWQVSTQIALLQQELDMIDLASGKRDHLLDTSTATDNQVELELKRRGLEERIFVLNKPVKDDLTRFTELK